MGKLHIRKQGEPQPTEAYLVEAFVPGLGTRLVTVHDRPYKPHSSYRAATVGRGRNIKYGYVIYGGAPGATFVQC